MHQLILGSINNNSTLKVTNEMICGALNALEDETSDPEKSKSSRLIHLKNLTAISF